MERKDAIARIMEAVASIYSREEARIIAWEVAGHIGGFTRSQGIADPSSMWSASPSFTVYPLLSPKGC